MYTISVSLKSEKSFAMRKTLYYANFDIIRCNMITGNFEVLHEDYSSEKVLYRDEAIRFNCIYNGETLPPQPSFRKLEEEKCVLAYAIEKRSS